MSHSLRAIVIGSGVAGLASAVRLVLQGIEVTVFEKNNYPGGKLSHFEMNGYHFDSGPSLFTQPENIEELFESAGENIYDYFEYAAVDVACKYFYEDGTKLTAYTNKEKFAKELAEKINEQPQNIQQYLQQSANLYNNIGTVFLNHSLHKKSSLFKAPLGKAVTTVRWNYLFGTLNSVNKASFTDERTVQLFNRYATYNGSNPYKAPGMLSLIPHLEYNQGTYYPKGGMISITNSLYQLALKKGIKFEFNRPVQRIINSEGKVKGVVVNNKNIPADIVVSNMDVYGTYKYLLNDNSKANQLLNQERSSSAFVFYWGINKTFDELGLHNIFFSKDYKAEFESLFAYKKFYNDPTVYINITAKCEPGIQAPTGKENWFVMVNAPANVGQDWKAYQQQYRATIIAKLNRLLQTDIEPLIESEQILDPVLIEERTASYMGSLYGTSSNSRIAAFLRHPNFTNKIKGLYFAGGSVHPGGGIPLCLKSAKIMSELVKEDIKKWRH
ncbi:phytoene desaturase [Panacibacter ginsenosidivorans]|uniref:Phytoene desaturase n=1 Tax=Panacibacter ginsenosidivorans TaxID=1813871 RepID=A0A5B8VA62_9BACT|nr:1-hydroxycarotenoid 3,4-desaturase CrtD [Panacibacter ginsenosidivorans]QEC68005.1 phytoene desaturase [Panacibacter ginsenosidivorans]